jgi:hypothetical protein
VRGDASSPRGSTTAAAAQHAAASHMIVLFVRRAEGAERRLFQRLQLDMCRQPPREELLLRIGQEIKHRDNSGIYAEHKFVRRGPQ